MFNIIRNIKINPYKAIVLSVLFVFIATMTCFGVPVARDKFATWVNDGFPAEDARLAVAFDIDVKNRGKK